MSTHNTEPLSEYGVVFEDAELAEGMFEDDLVRHQSNDMERATAVTIEALAKGIRSAIVFREGDDEWLTMYSRQSPSGWVKGRRNGVVA